MLSPEVQASLFFFKAPASVVGNVACSLLQCVYLLQLLRDLGVSLPKSVFIIVLCCVIRFYAFPLLTQRLSIWKV